MSRRAGIQTQISYSEALTVTSDLSAVKPSGLLPGRISFVPLLLFPLKKLVKNFRHTKCYRDHESPSITTLLEKSNTINPLAVLCVSLSSPICLLSPEKQELSLTWLHNFYKNLDTIKACGCAHRRHRVWFCRLLNSYQWWYAAPRLLRLSSLIQEHEAPSLPMFGSVWYSILWVNTQQCIHLYPPVRTARIVLIIQCHKQCFCEALVRLPSRTICNRICRI